jgi:futalosine hydrolase
VTRPSYGGIAVDDFVVVFASPFEQPFTGVQAHELGVGKVAATASLYSLLMAIEQRQPVRAVLLCGVAGAYPERHRRGKPPVRPGQVCVVGSDVLADEGVETPSGFIDFGKPVEHGVRTLDGGPFPANPRIAAEAAARLAAPIVKGATVSTCSGTELLSRKLHERTGADIETMEGAAVASVCRRREVPLLHVRAISNWTGDRNRGEWNLGAAVDAMQLALRKLLESP